MKKNRVLSVSLIIVLNLWLGYGAFAENIVKENIHLPDFINPPYRIINSGNTKSINHPEWGLVKAKLYAYNVDDDPKKTRHFIAVFLNSDGSYRYAEWIHEWTYGNNTKFIIRGYQYTDQKFMLEKIKHGSF